MAMTLTKSPRLYQPSRHAQVHLRTKPATARTNPATALVPKAKVQEMLREIAFVLHATRRISREMMELNIRIEGAQSCPGSETPLGTK